MGMSKRQKDKNREELSNDARQDSPDRINKVPPVKAILPLASWDVLPNLVHFSPRTDTMMDARPRSRAIIIKARHP